MDSDLAGAVFRRWENGLPVSEINFYKAASILGVDPAAALTEARYYTALDSWLSKDAAMSPVERHYFSLAVGEDPDHLEKVASAYSVDPDLLLVQKLAARGFHPDLEKIALMLPPEAIEEMLLAQQEQEAGGGGGPDQGPGGGQAAGDPGAAQDPAAALAPQGPQPGAQLQQDPNQRFKPAPTAPDQIMPGEAGNLDALLQEQQGAFGGQAEENGGLPPSGAEQPPPPPPAPNDRILQVAPQMDPETAQRYGDKLTEFEEQMGMPISDPKQMVKFVESMQKVDTKYMQEGIKQFAEQQEAEMGIGQQVAGSTPTVKGFGPNDPPPGQGAAGAGGPPSPGGAPGGAGGPPGGGAPGGEDPAAAAAEAEGAGGPPMAGAGGGKPKVQPGQPLPAAQAAGTKPKPGGPGGQAAEKVAHAARALARAHLGV